MPKDKSHPGSFYAMHSRVAHGCFYDTVDRAGVVRMSLLYCKKLRSTSMGDSLVKVQCVDYMCTSFEYADSRRKPSIHVQTDRRTVNSGHDKHV